MVAGKDLFILDLGYHNLLFEGIENMQLILVYLLQIERILSEVFPFPMASFLIIAVDTLVSVDHMKTFS
jgi:hypothetical protein